jgi:hypothetical protein
MPAKSLPPVTLIVALFYLTVVGAVAGVVAWRTVAPSAPTLLRYEPLEPQAKAYVPGGRSCDPGAPPRMSGGQTAKPAVDPDDCAEMAETHRLVASDLVQQTRAAQAAEQTARLSYDQARIAAYQTILNVLTLFATAIAGAAAFAAANYAKWAAKEGARSANAADEAVKIARLSDRPHLLFDLKVVSGSAANIAVEDGVEVSPWHLQYTIKNYGNSPAWISRIVFDAQAIEKSLVRRGIAITPVYPKKSDIFRILAPGETITQEDGWAQSYVKLSPDDNSAVFSNAKRLALYGLIEYSDAHSMNHVNRFGYWVIAHLGDRQRALAINIPPFDVFWEYT